MGFELRGLPVDSISYMVEGFVVVAWHTPLYTPWRKVTCSW